MSEPTPPAVRLWIAAASARFFLVDDAAPRVAGPTWVADLDEGEARVSLDAWLPFEITEAVAAEHYRERLSEGAERLQTELERETRAVAAALPGLDALLSRLGGPDADDFDGPEALSLLTGRSRAEIERAPAEARDAVLDALTALAGRPTPAPAAPASTRPVSHDAVDATAEERAALGEIVQRWTFGATTLDAPTEPGASALPGAVARDDHRSPQALLESLRRALKNLGTFESTESPEARLARYRTDARAAIDRATAGWKPPTPTVEELLRMGDDQ